MEKSVSEGDEEGRRKRERKVKKKENEEKERDRGKCVMSLARSDSCGRVNKKPSASSHYQNKGLERPLPRLCLAVTLADVRQPELATLVENQSRRTPKTAKPPSAGLLCRKVSKSHHNELQL